MSRLARAVTIDDLRRLARQRLPRAVFDFVEGGPGDERIVARNRAAFDRLLFRTPITGPCVPEASNRILSPDARADRAVPGSDHG